MLAIVRGTKNLPTHVDVADSTNDSNRNCPEDAQKPHECSGEDVHGPGYCERLNSVLPDLIAALV
jgi:hypothetical protein